MSIKKSILLAMLLIFLAGCQLGGLSAKEQAATMVAQTAAAAPPTDTQAPAPTDTSVPPTDTPVPLPTDTATPSGPLVIKDDFSTKSDNWGKCDKCDWKDGKLYFGPYDARGEGVNQVFVLTCEACGEHTYFRIAADVAFAAGVAGDRTFGVGGTIPDKFYAGTGITPYQLGIMEAYDFGTNEWTGSDFKFYGAIKPGRATNRVEFAAKPNPSGGIDYYSIVNGKTIIVLYNRDAITMKPALYLGWHSVGVTFDNFEFEELVP